MIFLRVAVGANEALGSAACLIKDEVTGLFYKDENLSHLFERVTKKDLKQIKAMGDAAYQSMSEMWSAVRRTVELSQFLLMSDVGQAKTLYEEGPCSFIR